MTEGKVEDQGCIISRGAQVRRKKGTCGVAVRLFWGRGGAKRDAWEDGAVDILALSLSLPKVLPAAPLAAARLP